MRLSVQQKPPYAHDASEILALTKWFLGTDKDPGFSVPKLSNFNQTAADSVKFLEDMRKKFRDRIATKSAPIALPGAPGDTTTNTSTEAPEDEESVRDSPLLRWR